MDLSVLFIALPWITADLAPTGTQELWIMDIYGFVLAGLLVTMGSIGDRIGRRRLLMIGALLFGVASLVSALSTTPEMLITGRVILGVGGAALLPSVLAMIRVMFTDEDQRRTAIGPIIGGLLLEHFHWGSVFLINIPIMAVLLIAAPMLLRESRDPNPGLLDPVSVLLPLPAVVSVILGIKELVKSIGEGSAVNPVHIISIIIGVLFGAWFIRRQLATSTPLLDVRLFGRTPFTASIVANMTVVFAVGGMGLLAVQFLQTVLGYGPFTAALWMLPTVAGTLVGVTAVSVLAKTLRPAFLVAAGLLFVAAGFLTTGTIDSDSSVLMLISAYTVMTVGVGITTTLGASLVMSTAPEEKAGAVSSIYETAGEFGGALGIAVLGTISGAVYADRMGGSSDTIGAAVAEAERMPDATAAPLLDAAFDAFAPGFSLAATVGGILAAAVAVVAAFTLRKLPVSAERPEETDDI